MAASLPAPAPAAASVPSRATSARAAHDDPAGTRPTAPARCWTLPADGSPRRLMLRTPMVVQVQRGHVWLTVAGQPHDHFLAPGQRRVLPAGAAAWCSCVAAAGGPSIVSVRPAAAGEAPAAA